MVGDDLRNQMALAAWPAKGMEHIPAAGVGMLGRIVDDSRRGGVPHLEVAKGHVSAGMRDPLSEREMVDVNEAAAVVRARPAFPLKLGAAEDTAPLLIAPNDVPVYAVQALFIQLCV